METGLGSLAVLVSVAIELEPLETALLGLTSVALVSVAIELAPLVTALFGFTSVMEAESVKENGFAAFTAVGESGELN